MLWKRDMMLSIRWSTEPGRGRAEQTDFNMRQTLRNGLSTVIGMKQLFFQRAELFVNRQITAGHGAAVTGQHRGGIITKPFFLRKRAGRKNF